MHPFLIVKLRSISKFNLIAPTTSFGQVPQLARAMKEGLLKPAMPVGHHLHLRRKLRHPKNSE